MKIQRFWFAKNRRVFRYIAVAELRSYRNVEIVQDMESLQYGAERIRPDRGTGTEEGGTDET